MILIFTFDPLPGKNDVTMSCGEIDHVFDSDGRLTDMIMRPTKIEGILRVAEVVSCDCFVRGLQKPQFTAFDLSTTPPTMIARVFSINMIKQAGGKVPGLFFDLEGNLADSNGNIIMQGSDQNPLLLLQAEIIKKWNGL